MPFFVKERSFYTTFAKLTFTIALQNVIVFGVNLADNIMLGRFSQEALSGTALVNQIQFLLQMLVLGVAEAALIFSARSWGERDIPAIRRVTSIAVKAGLLLALALFAVCALLPTPVLSLLSNQAADVAEGAAYLRIICWSYPLFAVAQLLVYALRSVETVRIGFYVSLITLVLNVSLNYILIFGHFGAPRLGVRGAAIATLISRIVEFAAVILYTFCIDKKIALKPRDFVGADRALLKDFLRKGTPVFLASAVWGVAQAAQTAVLGHTEGPAIAANSIATTVFQIVSVVTYASASAAAVMIGKTIGENRPDRIRPYTRTLQILFLIIGVCTGLILYFLRGPIIALYDITPEAKAVASQFMTVLAVTVVGTSYQMACHTGIVRAGGDTGFLLKVDMIFMWLVVIPLASLAAFVFHAPPVVVFACLKCDQILKCGVAVVKVNRYNWIRSIRAGEAEPKSTAE